MSVGQHQDCKTAHTAAPRWQWSGHTGPGEDLRGIMSLGNSCSSLYRSHMHEMQQLSLSYAKCVNKFLGSLGSNTYRTWKLTWKLPVKIYKNEIQGCIQLPVLKKKSLNRKKCSSGLVQWFNRNRIDPFLPLCPVYLFSCGWPLQQEHHRQ